MARKQHHIIQELIEFLQKSPTPYHAVENIKSELLKHKFTELTEDSLWDIQRGGKFFITRSDSSIIALQFQKNFVESGLKMVGTHTDSPALKLKPNPDLHRHGYFQTGVEVYGGVLLAPWFDRDLSLAGKVTYLTNKGALKSYLLNFERPIAVIPNLAIHLNRQANDGKAINPQHELPPVILQSNNKTTHLRELLIKELRTKKLDVSEILEFDLSFYDCNPPQVVGFESEFLCSARLDNLLSTFIGLKAILQANSKTNALLICSDHEEVGSASFSGAEGNFLLSVLQRISLDPESFSRMMSKSLLLSIDNAHGVHPNYADKHDSNHGPHLNAGPVLKINSNQRYATSHETASEFALMCKKAKVPLQKFVTRSDMGCGSTIGPITATRVGVKTVDLGVPTFAMHSIRETAGVKDVEHLLCALAEYFG